MNEKYTLNRAFDNRYKNMMLLNLFFVLGLCFFLTNDILSGMVDFFEYIFFILFILIVSILNTLSRYNVYRHLSKHGTMFSNVNYKIIKEKRKKACVYVKIKQDDEIIEIKSYRHYIPDSKIGKKGKVDILVDLQHSKYYYVFYQ